MGTSGSTSRTSAAASLPMSSPSRSKSVAITTESAFFARFLSVRMISFSAGTFSTGAQVRYGRLGTFQPLRSTPSLENGLRAFSNGGRGSASGIEAGTVVPSSSTPTQPSPSTHLSSRGKSTAMMWPRRPIDTHSSPSRVNRQTGVL